MHREQPVGAAAFWGPGGATVGPLPGSPQAGLGLGGDGRIHSGDRGGLHDSEDPLTQPWNDL